MRCIRPNLFTFSASIFLKLQWHQASKILKNVVNFVKPALHVSKKCYIPLTDIHSFVVQTKHFHWFSRYSCLGNCLIGKVNLREKTFTLHGWTQMVVSSRQKQKETPEKMSSHFSFFPSLSHFTFFDIDFPINSYVRFTSSVRYTSCALWYLWKQSLLVITLSLYARCQQEENYRRIIARAFQMRSCELLVLCGQTNYIYIFFSLSSYFSIGSITT